MVSSLFTLLNYVAFSLLDSFLKTTNKQTTVCVCMGCVCLWVWGWGVCVCMCWGRQPVYERQIGDTDVRKTERY